MPSAERLLEKMRQTKHGWGYNDLDKLYQGFGFEYREGGKHVVYSHPKHRSLIATVARHRSLPVGYIQTAIQLMDTLKSLEGGQNE